MCWRIPFCAVVPITASSENVPIPNILVICENFLCNSSFGVFKILVYIGFIKKKVIIISFLHLRKFSAYHTGSVFTQHYSFVLKYIWHVYVEQCSVYDTVWGSLEANYVTCNYIRYDINDSTCMTRYRVLRWTFPLLHLLTKY